MNVTTYTINADIAEEIKIVQIADLHGRPHEKILEEIKGVRADFAAVTGDLIDGKRPREIDSASDFLKKCAASLPTFYSLGNHERELDEESLFRLKRTGARLLDDRYETYKGIKIGGLNSGYIGGGTVRRMKDTPAPNMDFLKDFAKGVSYKVLLCHHPEYYEPYIRDMNIDLILSGHAHGGQWRVFGRGIFAPGQGFLPKYTSGVVDGRLVISRGLSNTLRPVPRFFNRRELVVVRIAPKEK